MKFDAGIVELSLGVSFMGSGYDGGCIAVWAGGMRDAGRMGLRVALALALAAGVMIGPVAAQKYPTIVGEWYAEDIGPHDCGTPFAFHIGPMNYAEESLVCTFDDVRRDGWQVTWNGSCRDGSSQFPSQVIALEERGRLSMWFDGQPGWSALRRCTAR